MSGPQEFALMVDLIIIKLMLVYIIYQIQRLATRDSAK